MPERTPTPSYPIVADRPRNLRFTSEAVIQIEEDFAGKPIWEILNELTTNAQAGKIRSKHVFSIVAAACQHEDRGVSWQDIASQVEFADLPAFLKRALPACLEGLRLAMPKLPEGEGQDPNAPAPAAA